MLRSVLFTVVVFAVSVLAACEPPNGACVSRRTTSGGTTTYDCYEDERADICDSSADNFYPDSSCGAAGYPYYCSPSDMRKWGLEGASRYLSNSDCDPRIPASSSGGATGGQTGSDPSAQCGADQVWTCEYDGQATPMCQAACAHTGSQRTDTCSVLASYMDSGNAGECCTVCR